MHEIAERNQVQNISGNDRQWNGSSGRVLA
jgi:hypothetical protein